MTDHVVILRQLANLYLDERLLQAADELLAARAVCEAAEQLPDRIFDKTRELNDELACQGFWIRYRAWRRAVAAHTPDRGPNGNGPSPSASEGGGT